MLLATRWERGRLLLTFESRMNEIGKEINRLLEISSLIFLSMVFQYRFVQTATMQQVFNEIYSFWSYLTGNEPNFILTSSIARESAPYAWRRVALVLIQPFLFYIYIKFVSSRNLIFIRCLKTNQVWNPY